MHNYENVLNDYEAINVDEMVDSEYMMPELEDLYGMDEEFLVRTFHLYNFAVGGDSYNFIFMIMKISI